MGNQKMIGHKDSKGTFHPHNSKGGKIILPKDRYPPEQITQAIVDEFIDKTRENRELSEKMLSSKDSLDIINAQYEKQKRLRKQRPPFQEGDVDIYRLDDGKGTGVQVISGKPSHVGEYSHSGHIGKDGKKAIVHNNSGLFVDGVLINYDELQDHLNDMEQKNARKFLERK